MIDFTTLDGARNAFRILQQQVQSLLNWDFKGNRLQNIADGIANNDAVSVQQLNNATKATPTAQTTSSNLTNLTVANLKVTNTLNPATDNAIDLGTSSNKFKEVYAYFIEVINTIIMEGLSGSLPLKLDSSKNIISAAINLSGTDITSTLPIANGGTNGVSAGAARSNLSAAHAGTYTCTISSPLTGTISGTADLTTGAVTGTCIITAGTIQVTITV